MYFRSVPDDPELVVATIKAAKLATRELDIDEEAQGNELIGSMIVAALSSGIQPDAFKRFVSPRGGVRYGFYVSDEDYVGIARSVDAVADIDPDDDGCAIEIQSSGEQAGEWVFMGCYDEDQLVFQCHTAAGPVVLDEEFFVAVITDALRRLLTVS